MPLTSKLIAATRGAKRRALWVALASGLAAVLPLAVVPALAEVASDPGAGRPTRDKLGSHDASLLADAKADGVPHVTLMFATRPGSAREVADEIEAGEGASVGYTHNKIGYVRATVRTADADIAIDTAERLSAVVAIDLNEEIALPDPAPVQDAGNEADTAGESDGGPGRNTPARNPYQPSFETGAVDFVADHPNADGRGVTIGILDEGVDLAHPALQKTTTGKTKIVDSVTATDPVVDKDHTWRPMLQEVTGPTFNHNGLDYTAPEGDHLVNVFQEKVATGEFQRDVNRDGDTTDSWALLYTPAEGTVRVDTNDNSDFTDDAAMRPYRKDGDVGHFGTDDPDTAIAEAVPFTVEIRKDVPMDPYGRKWRDQTRDFVNIGIVAGSHGTHVAGIAAANGLFGGKMDGAAPGAQIVSARACGAQGCTATALTEGVIDLVANHDVDMVNMSLGGLPPLNDGNNARAQVYNQLVGEYGVHLIVSAGNEGPGVNTVADPSVVDRAISVGATISRETHEANFGSTIGVDSGMMPFSSTGPRDDGGFKPTVSGPGAAVSAIPTWLKGSAIREASYDLPPGYAMYAGTSMSAPQVAGSSALLLSAAKQQDVEVHPDALRIALTSSADPVPGAQAHQQGAGLMNTEGAWRLIARGITPRDYQVSAPVDHVLRSFLATPGAGTGIYDRESAPAVGESESYEVTLVRMSGPHRAVRHELALVNNHDDTFELVGDASVQLPLGEPVTVTVRATPKAYGARSAVLEVDDPETAGVDTQMMATIVVPRELSDSEYVLTSEGTAQRDMATSYFVRVPEGTETLQVDMSGLDTASQTRWIAYQPAGVPGDKGFGTRYCYANYDHPKNRCKPDRRSYRKPTPGVWEIEVESRFTTPQQDNPYTLTATALGATFAPASQTLDEAQIGTAAPVSWEVTNNLAALEEATLSGGQLGSIVTRRPTVKQDKYYTYTVEVEDNVSRFDVAVGSPKDAKADLDLEVYRGGKLVAVAGTPTSEESVSIKRPKPGTYKVRIHGFHVPSGSTAFDLRDVQFSPGLGVVTVDGGQRLSLPTGASSTVTAEVTAANQPPKGRQLYGEVVLRNADGIHVGSGGARIEQVTPAGE